MIMQSKNIKLIILNKIFLHDIISEKSEKTRRGIAS